MLSDQTSERATRLILDAVAVILADDANLTAAPTKGALVYEYMREDGSVALNVFGTTGMWTAELVGFLVVGEQLALESMNDPPESDGH